MHPAIHSIQEAIDEHKMALPEGLYLELMNKLQQTYDSGDDLYEITYAVIDKELRVELATSLCEEVDDMMLDASPDRWEKAIRRSRITVNMVEENIPSIHTGEKLLFIMSVEKR